ncbi:MAG: transposase DNA-binding-containing protein [Massilia sp.]
MTERQPPLKNSLPFHDLPAIGSTAWTATEFAQRDLVDARLNWRARTDGEHGDSIGGQRAQGSNGWGEMMAAYRFFDNASVDWRAIL